MGDGETPAVHKAAPHGIKLSTNGDALSVDAFHHGAGDDLDAELCQPLGGFFRQRFSKAGKNVIGAVEQEYRCCHRIDPATTFSPEKMLSLLAIGLS